MDLIIIIMSDVAVVLLINMIIDYLYNSQLETAPNCEAAEEVKDKKNTTKLLLLPIVAVAIFIAFSEIF